MTKERVEELIKQKATIYDRKTTKIMLDKYSHVYQDYLILGHSIGKQYEFYLRDLFETEEQADWAYKTIIERTERFEPPMWEEIEDKFCFKFTLNNENYNMEVHKTGNLIVIWNTTKKEAVYTALCKDCNKKNYEKACQIVKDLFNGKK